MLSLEVVQYFIIGYCFTSSSMGNPHATKLLLPQTVGYMYGDFWQGICSL